MPPLYTMEDGTAVVVEKPRNLVRDFKVVRVLQHDRNVISMRFTSKYFVAWAGPSLQFI